jgi:mono/diheme cytochrome c family protein
MPTLSPEMAAGHTVFQSNCAICHALTPDTVVRGPSLYGVATRAPQRVPGMDARDYIYTSILRPGDYVVDGFENIMPTNLAKDLTGEEMDAVVNYLLTFEQ